MLKVGQKLVYEDQECELDIMDWECNSPPMGFLWIRKMQQAATIPGAPLVTVRGEAVGVIHIQTGQVFPQKHISEFVPYVPSMPHTAKLVYDMYFPKPPTLWEKFLNLFKKKVA